MTKKLFWEDMYASQFDAVVTKVDGAKVTLDQTAFNPRGGGIVPDTGTIQGARVVEAVKDGDDVVHVMEAPPAFAVGDKVHGVLDWDRRHRIMRMHTAAHMLSSVVNSRSGALITGNQIGPDESRVDFNLEDFQKETVEGYVAVVNEEAAKGHKVSTFFMKRDEALATPGFVKLAGALPPTVEMLRIVKIGDVDTQADGGVHVKDTKEIGTLVALRTENKGKSNRRLYFTVK